MSDGTSPLLNVFEIETDEADHSAPRLLPRPRPRRGPGDRHAQRSSASSRPARRGASTSDLPGQPRVRRPSFTDYMNARGRPLARPDRPGRPPCRRLALPRRPPRPERPTGEPAAGDAARLLRRRRRRPDRPRTRSSTTRTTPGSTPDGPSGVLSDRRFYDWLNPDESSRPSSADREARKDVSSTSVIHGDPCGVQVHRSPVRPFPREPARAPGGLEVVAADQAVEVEHLAREVEAGLEAAFEGRGVDLVERDAAAGDLGLGEAERARRPAGASPSGRRRAAAARRAKVRARPVGGDARRGQRGRSASRRGTVAGRRLATGRRPTRLAAWSCRSSASARTSGAKSSDKVEPVGPSWRATARLTSRIAGPGQAEVGEQDRLAALEQGRAGGAEDRPRRASGTVSPFRPGHPVGLDPDRHQRGPGLDDRVAEPPGDRVAVAGRPAAGVRLAADRDDHPAGRRDLAPASVDREAALDRLDARRGASRAERRRRAAEAVRSRASGRRSPGRRREDLAVALDLGGDALGLEQRDRVARRRAPSTPGRGTCRPAPNACWMLRAPGPRGGRRPGRSGRRRRGGCAGPGRWSGCSASRRTSGS